MSQYTVYRNTSPNSREQYPYFIGIQNELLSDIDSRVIMPISLLVNKNSQVKIITPVIEISNLKYVIMTKSITTLPKDRLKVSNIVCIKPEVHSSIVATMDLIISGI